MSTTTDPGQAPSNKTSKLPSEIPSVEPSKYPRSVPLYVTNVNLSRDPSEHQVRYF